MRRLLVIVSVGVVTALAAWLGARAVDDRRYREDLARAREEFGARRFATARALLARLAERRPGDGAVELLLGTTEKMLGRPDDALAAWRRIPDGADQAAQAALAGGRLALALGRYRVAEKWLLRASQAGGDLASEASHFLEV